MCEVPGKMAFGSKYGPMDLTFQFPHCERNERATESKFIERLGGNFKISGSGTKPPANVEHNEMFLDVA